MWKSFCRKHAGSEVIKGRVMNVTGLLCELSALDSRLYRTCASYTYAEGLLSLILLLPHCWDSLLPISQLRRLNKKWEVQPDILAATLLCSSQARSFLSAWEEVVRAALLVVAMLLLLLQPLKAEMWGSFYFGRLATPHHTVCQILQWNLKD